MHRCVIPVLMALSAAALGAQAQDTTTFPPVPSSVPRLLLPYEPTDSGFAEWRKLPLPRHDKTPAAWTLRAGDWDFLISTPRAMDAMDSSRIIDTTLANCRKPLNISDADSARLADARPWAVFDSLAEERPAIVISIMPVLRNFTECGFKNLGRPAMIRRGMRFVTEFAYDATRDPSSAAVLSQLRVVKPLMIARAPVLVMSKGGIPQQTTDQIRLYIPFDAIQPTLTGDMPHVELMIWTKAGGEPDHIPLPSNIMHTLWWDNLRWRAQRLLVRDRVTTTTPPELRRKLVRVPVPSDTGLRSAGIRQLGGHDADAAKMIIERIADGKLSVNDRRIALMTLANTFQVDDDQPSAAFVANELTAMDPCALSGSSLPSKDKIENDAYTSLRSTGALLDHTRPGVRCTSERFGVTFLRGLVFPGGGQYTTWSHLVGLSTTALTITMAYTSYDYLHSANNWYKQYQADASGYAPRKFTTAVSQRNNASNLVYATVGVWVGSAIEAEIQERVHAARLAAVHDFWFKPILAPVRVSPAGAPGLGAGLRFEFH
ncbi:MAG TPA: hypothetical protein VN613_09805 [Gemmatimonadaceae bacterium]|nr:hypothetical protein [Gemmatimonadaceae bacterium]